MWAPAAALRVTNSTLASARCTRAPTLTLTLTLTHTLTHTLTLPLTLTLTLTRAHALPRWMRGGDTSELTEQLRANFHPFNVRGRDEHGAPPRPKP